LNCTDQRHALNEPPLPSQGELGLLASCSERSESSRSAAAQLLLPDRRFVPVTTSKATCWWLRVYHQQRRAISDVSQLAAVSLLYVNISHVYRANSDPRHTVLSCYDALPRLPRQINAQQFASSNRVDPSSAVEERSSTSSETTNPRPELCDCLLDSYKVAPRANAKVHAEAWK
jgi:hypothetical protein